MLAEKIMNVYTDFSKVSVGDVFELEHQLYIKLSGSDGYYIAELDTGKLTRVYEGFDHYVIMRPGKYVY